MDYYWGHVVRQRRVWYNMFIVKWNRFQVQCKVWNSLRKNTVKKYVGIYQQNNVWGRLQYISCEKNKMYSLWNWVYFYLGRIRKSHHTTFDHAKWTSRNSHQKFFRIRSLISCIRKASSCRVICKIILDKDYLYLLILRI